jgi:tRNA(Ile)-lysidine synthase TilS/MesJ
MEKTLKLLQEELKKEEYKPMIEELKKFNKSSKKYEERNAIKRRILSVFSKNEEQITDMFIKEFKDATYSTQAYISLAEQFIPEKGKIFEDILIGRIFDKSSEKLFSTDKEVSDFAYMVVKDSQVGNWGMGNSDVLYERAERYINEQRKKHKI